MSKSRPPYPLEFRQRMVEVVRAGRNLDELAEEFEPSAQAIRKCQAGGSRSGRAQRRADDRRSRRVAAPAAREQAAQDGARDPKKSRGLVRSGERVDTRSEFEFVKANQAEFPVRLMYRTLGLSPSGYYAWDGRAPAVRTCANEALLVIMRGTYAGAGRIVAWRREARQHGTAVEPLFFHLGSAPADSVLLRGKDPVNTEFSCSARRPHQARSAQGPQAMTG